MVSWHRLQFQATRYFCAAAHNSTGSKTRNRSPGRNVACATLTAFFCALPGMRLGAEFSLLHGIRDANRFSRACLISWCIALIAVGKPRKGLLEVGKRAHLPAVESADKSKKPRSLM